MSFCKEYDNGLRLVVKKIDGVLSVASGILVFTGSANETDENNGISHFIEHTVFKGTKKRSSFEISDFTDSIGAQINAFTSKEMTCFYTKSTTNHFEECLDVLSDIFFDATFLKEELEKEKGVIIEEINMTEDTPDDLCLDLLAQGFYGANTYGRTILGPIKNVKKFSYNDVKKYMDSFYTADNVVISIVGNVDEEKTVNLIDKYFGERFSEKKSEKQALVQGREYKNIVRKKQIEQSHLGICFDGVSSKDENMETLSLASIVLGGGMSSRLFQKIREELGLCYTVYSYNSQYKDNGVMEIYAGVATDMREVAFRAILDEIDIFKNKGITEKELIRAKEQMKSSLILGQESTTSQMILYGKYCLLFNDVFDFDSKIKKIDGISKDEVNSFIKSMFDFNKACYSSVGPSSKKLIIK